MRAEPSAARDAGSGAAAVTVLSDSEHVTAPPRATCVQVSEILAAPPVMKLPLVSVSRVPEKAIAMLPGLAAVVGVIAPSKKAAEVNLNVKVPPAVGTETVRAGATAPGVVWSVLVLKVAADPFGTAKFPNRPDVVSGPTKVFV